MPIIIVDDERHNLYYEDTGAPPNSDGKNPYTTFVLIHGTSFHGQTFRRLLPLAAEHNIRLVVLNRRDYPGSSPYTEADLSQIDSPKNIDGHIEFARARAKELAQFLKGFVEKKGSDIPRASEDWKFGGVVILSWSSGPGFSLPLLAYADIIPRSTREVLEPYLRSHIVFDAPRWVLGKFPLENRSDMIRSDFLPRNEFVRRFGGSVNEYYVHKSLISRDINDLQLVASKDAPAPAIATQDLDEITSYDVLFRSEIKAQIGEPATYAERVRRAIFDDGLAKYWPKCRVDVVWCEHSVWESVDVVWTLASMRERAYKDGIIGRPLRIVMFPGANHFPHWNEPEKTMEFFAGVANS